MLETTRGGCRPVKRGGCRDEGSGSLSVAAAVRHYGLNYRKRGQAELAHFARLPTLNDAIRAAARSEDEDGKRLSHQRRLKQEAIRQATTALLIAADRLQESADFDELFKRVEEALSE